MIRLVFLLFLFVLLGAGLWLGPELVGEKGYVLIAIKNYTIELTVISLGMMILLLYGALSLSEWLLRYALSSTVRARRWLGDRRVRKAREKTRAGQLALVEGDWRSAERLMLSAARDSESPVLNYLAAAEAAQEQGSESRRDNYLQLAHGNGHGTLAVGLTRARLQIRDGQLEHALAALNELRQQQPQNNQVLRLLQGLLLKLEDWDQLVALLPDLKRFNVVSDSDWLQLQLQAWQGLLQRKSRHEGQPGISALWQDLPRKLRQQPELCLAYASALHEHGADDVAEVVLREALKRERHSDMLDLYSQLQQSEPAEALVRAEAWLKDGAENPALLSCLGQMAIRAEQWEKARDYLNRALAIRPTRQNYALLGAIHEQEQRAEAALEAYRKGAQLGV